MTEFPMNHFLFPTLLQTKYLFFEQCDGFVDPFPARKRHHIKEGSSTLTDRSFCIFLSAKYSSVIAVNGLSELRNRRRVKTNTNGTCCVAYTND